MIQHASMSGRQPASWLLLMGALSLNAQAEEVFQLPEAHVRLDFAVPLVAPLLPGDQLAVELDGYDVSAMLSCAGSNCSLALPVPLSGGVHQMRAMIFYDNGDIATVLEARVEVGSVPGGAAETVPAASSTERAEEPAAPMEAAAQQYFSALFSTGYRLDQQFDAQAQSVPRLTGNGGLSYLGAGSAEGWRWEAQLDAMYDSQSENNPDAEAWVLPTYRLAASSGAGLGRRAFALGTYNVAREDLLFSAYQRRGAVMSLGDSYDSPMQFDLFGLQSEPLTSAQSRLGYPDSAQERSSGGLLTFTPWQDQPQVLQITSGLIHGESTEGGTGMWAPDQQTRYGGDTWNLALDSRLFENTLWLHADYASTRFDSDGIGYAKGERQGTAHDLSAQLNSGSLIPSGPFDQWSLTLQNKQVGLDFYSLGNLGMPGDLLLNRANWQGYLGNLQLEAELARETNNVDDQADIATQSVERQLVNAYYYPMVDSEALPWRVLGMPSLNAGVSFTRRRQDGDDAQLFGYDLNDQTREYLAGVNFYQNYWNWSLQQTWQQTDDYSSPIEQQGYQVYEPPSDQRNRFTTLQVGFVPLDQLSINTSWQWNKLQETDDGSVSRNTGQGLDMAWQIVPQRWQLNASYFRGHDSSDFAEADFLGDDIRQQTANLQLTWSVAQPQGLKPGLDWFLRTSYAQFDSALFDQSLNSWQVLLGFNLRWDTHTQ